MIESAKNIASMTCETITNELDANPDYSLIIVGHSLGGGTAALLKALWHHRFKGRVKSYGYGTACVLPQNTAQEFDDIIALVGRGNPAAHIR